MTNTSFTLPVGKTFTLPANHPDERASRAAWIEYGRILGAIVAGADLRDVVEQLGTPALQVTSREWAPGIGQAVAALIEARGLDANCSEVWRELCGPATTTVLTEDGSCLVKGWCGCGEERAGEGSVYVERWTRAGREFHGWICRECRRLQQAG